MQRSFKHWSQQSQDQLGSLENLRQILAWAHSPGIGLTVLDCARSTSPHPSGTCETSSQFSCLLCSFRTDSQTILVDHINGHSVGDGDCKYYYTQQIPGTGPHQNQVTWTIVPTSEDAVGISSISDLPPTTTGPPLDVQMTPISNVSHPRAASIHLQEALHGSLCQNPSTREGRSGIEDMDVAGASLNSNAKKVQPIPDTSGKNRFSCPLCPYTSRNKTHVKHHIRIHTKERPFKCNICFYTFSQKHHLSRHVARHAGKTSHKCKMCPGKTFKSGTELALHMCSHTGKEPLECKVCFRAFLYESKFIRHMRTHANEKE